jgi:hypothetical protein
VEPESKLAAETLASPPGKTMAVIFYKTAGLVYWFRYESNS